MKGFSSIHPLPPFPGLAWRYQTPQMNEKEMWVHLLAYNLIRLLMTQAALDASVHPREHSFKHTILYALQCITGDRSAASWHARANSRDRAADFAP